MTIRTPLAQGCHPAIGTLHELMSKTEMTFSLERISEETGIHKNLFRYWFQGRAPSVYNLEQALNFFGHTLTAVKK